MSAGRFFEEMDMMPGPARLITRDDMVQRVIARLGSPVLDLELELEERNGLGHVHMAIDDCIDYYIRYTKGEATYLDFMVVHIRPGVIEYDVPEDVVEILDVAPSFGNGITPWTAFDIGPGETLVATTGWTQFDLVTFTAGMRYLSDIKHVIGVQYQVTFHPVQHKMRILPHPRTPTRIICPIYMKRKLAEMFANPLFRDFCVERTRMQWGDILSKDDFQMPGGGKVDGKGILATAEKRYEKILENLRKEAAPPFIATSQSM